MLFDHAAKLEQADNLDTLWNDLLAVLPIAGLDHAIYISVTNDFKDPFVRTSIDGLYDERPAQDDPFLNHCCTSYDIYPAGAAYLHRHPYISAEERAFIQSAGRRGLNAGLAIPMRLKGSERFGGFIVGNGQNMLDFERLVMPRAEELRLFFMIVHRRIEELVAPDLAQPDPDKRPGLVGRELPPVFDTLTPRETEVILLLSQGKRRAESARLCGISIHTLSGYAKSGYRKLGVSNAAQAAALIWPAQSPRA